MSILRSCRKRYLQRNIDRHQVRIRNRIKITILAQQYLPQNHLRMKYKNVWKRNLAQMLKEKINQLRYMEILIVKMLIPFRVVDIEIIEMIIGKM